LLLSLPGTIAHCAAMLADTAEGIRCPTPRTHGRCPARRAFALDRAPSKSARQGNAAFVDLPGKLASKLAIEVPGESEASTQDLDIEPRLSSTGSVGSWTGRRTPGKSLSKHSTVSWTSSLSPRNSVSNLDWHTQQWEERHEKMVEELRASDTRSTPNRRLPPWDSKISCGKPDMQLPPVEPNARWDKLTIRQWFDAIDKDHSDYVSKQEWLRFLQDKHQFRELILKVAGQQSFKERISTAGFLRGRAVATELKQVIRIFKDIDFDKDNKLDFEEFVELFRRTGHLIELKSEANPRHKILCLLGGISQDTKGVSNSMAGQLVDLTKNNLTGERRYALEEHILLQVPPESEAAQSIRSLRVQRAMLVNPATKVTMGTSCVPNRSATFS